MKKSLNINATRNGKKVSTSIGYVNPDVANSIAGGFAQMVNALTTNTFVNAEVVKKMDTTEEEQQSGGGGEKTKGVITVDTSTCVITYNGDGTLHYMDYNYADNWSEPTTITSGDTCRAKAAGFYIFAEETDNYTAAVFVAEPD